jgi:hypothetical protein
MYTAGLRRMYIASLKCMYTADDILLTLASTLEHQFENMKLHPLTRTSKPKRAKLHNDKKMVVGLF